MLAIERRKMILDLLKSEGRVMAAELSQKLGTCEDTIRRDLREMAADGLLQRVHGGALPRSPAETSFSYRQQQASPGKKEIAQKAARLVQPGMVVFLSGGTTNVELASVLPRDLPVTIITHNPAVAVALADHDLAEVVLIGGRLFKRTMVTVGSDTVDALRGMRADLCMLGVCSLHPEAGISMPDLEESYVQQIMINNAAETIALVSQEKLGTVSHFTVAGIQEVNMIVTEQQTPQALLEQYRTLGIEILQ
ncbi:MAG: DeoR/GlpR family DNA-binding transcription regulator [Anaerolineaceae bacterium]